MRFSAPFGGQGRPESADPGYLSPNTVNDRQAEEPNRPGIAAEPTSEFKLKRSVSCLEGLHHTLRDASALGDFVPVVLRPLPDHLRVFPVGTFDPLGLLA